jgi:hypothetical protein
VRFRASAFVIAVSAATLSACSSDDGTGPINTATASLTVDASTNWAYVRLGPDAPRLVTVTTPTTSSDWDLAFFGTNVMVNGGASGPGDVSAACICPATEPTTAQLQAMTPTTELARFEAVTAANVPADNLFVRDSLAPAVTGWYTGSGTAMTAAANLSWIIREGATAFTFTKFRVTQIRNPTSLSAGEVTFEYATQTAPGAAFGPNRTVTTTQLTPATPVYFDFTTGAVSTSANWDVLFSGVTIRLNGGVSGTGTVRAVPAGDNPSFATITAPIAQSIPAQVYAADSFSGQFLLKPWYKYNITGTDMQIWPMYQVYIVRRGNEVYKVQLIGYYSTAGAPRNITIRSARLR